MADDADQGHQAAHTQPPAAAAAEIPSAGALPGPDPLDLIAGSPDLDATDLLAVAAELVAAPRRGRGRPAGSLNRKSGDMIEYLQAMGHRDPWFTLSAIQTADTMKLAMALRVPMQEDGKVKTDKKGNVLYNPPQPLAVLDLQRRAATDLMNYHHAKKPQQLELPPGAPRPVMIVGEMNVSIAGIDGMLSGFEPPRKANEINGDVVRKDRAESSDVPST